MNQGSIKVKFYLGLHQPSDAEKIRYPVFISVSRLIHRAKQLAHDDWMMDSGGFTMILSHGRYTISETQYIDCIAHHNPRFAFCQDWMCEGIMLDKTGLTIEEHQIRTLNSYLSLSERDKRIRPVLQGWAAEDYVRHIAMYDSAGVRLDQVFGLGSVCSRNGSPQIIINIVEHIKEAAPQMQLHGFGVKTSSLAVCAHLLASADSMAWSSRGRRTKLCTWCTQQSCANCLEYALMWRRMVLAMVASGTLNKGRCSSSRRAPAIHQAVLPGFTRSNESETGIVAGLPGVVARCTDEPAAPDPTLIERTFIEGNQEALEKQKAV